MHAVLAPPCAPPPADRLVGPSQFHWVCGPEAACTTFAMRRRHLANKHKHSRECQPVVAAVVGCQPTMAVGVAANHLAAVVQYRTWNCWQCASS